jgi:hypothetical protein
MFRVRYIYNLVQGITHLPDACPVIRDLQHLQSAALHCYGYLETGFNLIIIRKSLLLSTVQLGIGQIYQTEL